MTRVNLPTPNGLKPYEQTLWDLVRRSLTKGLTIGDNMNAAIVTLGTKDKPMTSGVEFAFANPLGAVPRFFQPLSARSVGGADMQVCDLSPIDVTRTDGMLGVTVGFGTGGHTGPYVSKTASAAQTINNNATTSLTFDTPAKSRFPSVITDDGTTFTVSEAGTYQAGVIAQLQTGVTYTEYQLWVQTTGAIINFGLNDFNIGWNNGPMMTVISPPIPMAAGDQLVAKIYQANGAAAARTVAGGSGANSTGRRITLARTYSEATGIVTGILWGG